MRSWRSWCEKKVPLTLDEPRQIGNTQIIDTAESTGILICFGQYVSEFVKAGKLRLIKLRKSTLFHCGEVP